MVIVMAHAESIGLMEGGRYKSDTRKAVFS